MYIRLSQRYSVNVFLVIMFIVGFTYVTPTHEVKRLAKEVGMDGKVKVLNFGVKGQTAEAQHALEDCIQNGYWLLLQNYHLADKPQKTFFTLLKVKVTWGGMMDFIYYYISFNISLIGSV